MILVDGERAESIDARDRGLLYGDGLFETIRFVHGRAPLWERHIARLAEGCDRLGLVCPNELLLLRDCAAAMEQQAQAVVRITITRGSGARGYALPDNAVERRIVAGFPAPEIPTDWYDAGIRVRFCVVRLAMQPQLAGIKHLNRLEQVLARAEWDDPAIAEGLMFDSADHAVCATAANLFIVLDGALITPSLDQCGVAGVARAEILAQRVDCRVATIDRAMLDRAEEIFLSSSVRGIVPVRATPERDYAVGVQTRALQAAWRERGLMPECAA